MYCYKCGKFIETDETLCPDCKAKVLGEQQPQPNQKVVVISQTTSAQATPVGKAPSNKNGVLSMVFSIVGAIFLGITFAGIGLEMYGMYLFCLLATVTCGIITLINGVKAITGFARACKNKHKKPIAGFIMGLVGLESLFVIAIYVMACIAVALETF